MSKPSDNSQLPPTRGDGYKLVRSDSAHDNIPMKTQTPSYPPPQPGMEYPPPQDNRYPQPGLMSGSQAYNSQQPMGYGQPGMYSQPGQPGVYPPPGQPMMYPPPGQPMMYPPPGQPFKEYGQGYPAGAITAQPGGWMSVPQNVPNCPGGLEYLATIDQLLVHQKVEILGAITEWDMNNTYTIKNTLGQNVYWVAEESDLCNRKFCGPRRSFEMKIFDAFRNEIIHLNRPLACGNICCPCCLQTMEVSSPPGAVVGSIEQNWSIFSNFSLKNATGEVILKIEGPICTYSCCKDVEFKITKPDGTQVGKISKQWTGLAREMFTDADHFGIIFPLDLDVQMKAVCIGAVFLIDMMYFEPPAATK